MREKKADSDHMVVVLTATEIGHVAWGRGRTRAEALRNARANDGKPSLKGYTVLTFSPEATIEGVDGTDQVRVRYRGPEPHVEDVPPARKKEALKPGPSTGGAGRTA